MSKYKQLCLIFTVLLLSLQNTHSALATYEPLRFYGALDYKVQVNDQITLFCYDEEGTRTVNFDRLTVLTNGQITIPFWGEVPIRGLTATEFKDSLNQNKPEIIVKKGVSCEVIVYHPEVKIPVIGQVRNPGYYPIGDSTVYDMIGAAGGFTFYSDESAVKVIRQRKDGTREDFFVNFELAAILGIQDTIWCFILEIIIQIVFNCDNLVLACHLLELFHFSFIENLKYTKKEINRLLHSGTPYTILISICAKSLMFYLKNCIIFCM